MDVSVTEVAKCNRNILLLSNIEISISSGHVVPKFNVAENAGAYGPLKAVENFNPASLSLINTLMVGVACNTSLW